MPSSVLLKVVLVSLILPAVISYAIDNKIYDPDEYQKIIKDRRKCDLGVNHQEIKLFVSERANFENSEENTRRTHVSKSKYSKLYQQSYKILICSV